MKVCFVSDCQVYDFWESRLINAKDTDLILFSPSSLGVVSYEKELAGETEYFQDIAKLSKELNCVVICACDTDTYGSIRKSAVIADSGKLLGVSDMVYIPVKSEYECGSNFIVYKTSIGKIGVVVGTDLYCFEAVKGMVLNDADLIVSIFASVNDYFHETVVKAESFLCGVPMAFVAENRALAVSVKGEVVFSSNLKVSSCEIKMEKVYDKLQFTMRGCGIKG